MKGRRFECCNEACGWIGSLKDCMHPKHEPDYLVCPECYEVVEPVDGDSIARSANASLPC